MVATPVYRTAVRLSISSAAAAGGTLQAAVALEHPQYRRRTRCLRQMRCPKGLALTGGGKIEHC